MEDLSEMVTFDQRPRQRTQQMQRPEAGTHLAVFEEYREASTSFGNKNT